MKAEYSNGKEKEMMTVAGISIEPSIFADPKTEPDGISIVALTLTEFACGNVEFSRSDTEKLRDGRIERRIESEGLKEDEQWNRSDLIISESAKLSVGSNLVDSSI
jgi:hypothetical protein